MAVPTSYSELTLAQYMHRQLGPLAVELEFTVGTVDAGSYADAVDEAALRCGVASVADVTNIRRLRLVARVEAWRLAMQATVPDTDGREDDVEEKTAQRHSQAKAQFAAAVAELGTFDTAAVAAEQAASAGGTAISLSLPTQAVW